MQSRPVSSPSCRPRILALILLLAGSVASGVALAAVWPNPVWRTATPESQGMDSALLEQGSQYSLSGGGSGMIVRHGFLVYSWGSLTTRYPIRSATKSFGATTLGLAIKDGRVTLAGKAQSYFAGIGVPPDSNIATGWLGDITMMNLATHTAGFDKPGGYTALLFKPGTEWGYSDGGADWLPDVLTTRYNRDLYKVMNARVFTELGIHSTDLYWRSNKYRSDTLNGVKRREFGSGISADVDAMARLGLLYLRDGVWAGTRILPSSYVEQVRTAPALPARLPVTNPTEYPAATSHYGLLWWNNADGRIPDVPTDAYWAWGLGDNLIIVIPSLDVVVARAGDDFSRTTDTRALDPFLGPIVASTQIPSSQAASGAEEAADHDLTGKAMFANAAPVVSAGAGQTVVLPQNTITVVDPAAPPTKMTAVEAVSTEFQQAGVSPERATWLAFSPAVSHDDAIATLRVRVAQVNAPGRIEVHRVLGAWDATSLASSVPPPIDPNPAASFTVEADDAGLVMETDVSDAVRSWTGDDAARGFVLTDVTGDVVLATDSALPSAEIRIDG